ncbi:beta-lactamase-like protein [Fimicolochytrium jonesii]|uniref:beta-lactamase-like protein n=1 Tax=Fimicolochytrium jonesii TaxID=1396493 RepID=UPI0022FF2198|nr:beta-lactamase-like protein [Fimicolochytrium jonesii]KAI8817703.1 beta-lactamase-like protein [Fimicolochytrium jonesii]
MKSYIQILGTQTGDTLPSVLVFFDSQRYLFNAGEGTQRFCLEQRVRLGKLTNLFLSRVQWDACGGIPGMLLSLADAGNKKITVHGGKNLTHFMAATRHFVFRMASSVQACEIPDGSKPFVDENMSVRPVTIYPVGHRPSDSTAETDGEPASKKAALAGDGPMPVAMPSSHANNPSAVSNGVENGEADPVTGQKRKVQEDSLASPSLSHEDALAYKQEIIRQMFNSGELPSVPLQNGSKRGFDNSYSAQFDLTRSRLNVPDMLLGKRDHTKVVRLPKSRPCLGVITYICEGHTQRGKFRPEKATALGVPAGYAFGRLANGHPFETEDGVTVLPEQVMDPDRPGAAFIILDCPSQEYIPDLTSNAAFAPHFAETTTNPVSLIVHNIGDGVLDSAEYRAWMKKFGDTTEHIIITRKHCPKPIIYKGTTNNLFRLNHMDPDVFKIPFYKPETEPLENREELPTNVTIGKNLMIYHTEPSRKIDTSEQKSIWSHTDPQGKVLIRHQHERWTEFKESAASLRKQIIETAEVEESPDVAGGDVLVCTLGTGASLPSPFRNVSSNFIDIPNYGSVLLDAGEGTYGQLYRRFNADEEVPLEDVLANLRLLFISHMHADHHLGAIRVLLERKNVLAQRSGPAPTLYIAAPPHYVTWLNEYAECEELGIGEEGGIEFLKNNELASPFLTAGGGTLDGLKQALGLQELKTIQVDHSPYAYAVSLVHINGFKAVYSGDCRPNMGLMKLGGDATVLIHEATFENDDKGCREALAKRHSTAREAVIVGGRMKAKWTILTHFSQRYPIAPPLGLDALPAEDRKKLTATVGVAFDLMSVKVKHMRRMGMYGETLQKLYSHVPPEETAAMEIVDAGADEGTGNQSRGADHARGRGSRGGRGGGRGRGGRTNDR